MKVYLICETVDLGYHVVSGFTSKARAEEEFNTLMQNALNQKIVALMKIGYTQVSAYEYAKDCGFYEIDEVEVITPTREPLPADYICDTWESVTGHQIQFGPSAEGRAMFISTDEVIEFARAIERAHGIGANNGN